MENLLAEVDPGQQSNSRDPSPTLGEGQRLGDSSHNGSSSAYPAVQVHRVGDGGSALAATTTTATLPKLNPGLSPEVGGSPLRLGTTRTSSESLPSYSEAMVGGGGDEEMLLDHDEGIDLTGTTPAWHTGDSWSWQGVAGHANSDVEDNSSTRGEGASPPASFGEEDDEFMMHSENVYEDFEQRGMRESAPAPDMRAVSIEAARVEDDDDDEELPVQELRADPKGEMHFTPEKQK